MCAQNAGFRKIQILTASPDDKVDCTLHASNVAHPRLPPACEQASLEAAIFCVHVVRADAGMMA